MVRPYRINGMLKAGWVKAYEHKQALRAKQVGSRIEITEKASGEVTDIIPLHAYGHSIALRVLQGLSRNMDHTRYTAELKES